MKKMFLLSEFPLSRTSHARTTSFSRLNHPTARTQNTNKMAHKKIT